jgi:hypothetical protein
VKDIADRASELESVIVDEDLHQTSVAVFEIANVLTGPRKGNNDELTVILLMMEQRVRELSGRERSPAVRKSHVRRKEVQDPMPVEEFFRHFERIKAENRHQLIDLLE